MLGYSKEQLRQLSFADLCMGDDLEECRVPLRELREGVRLQCAIETRFQRKDGTFLPGQHIFFNHWRTGTDTAEISHGNR
jgi:PAS domain S-box-containing protein